MSTKDVPTFNFVFRVGWSYLGPGYNYFSVDNKIGMQINI